jgi:hypothetical protein
MQRTHDTRAKIPPTAQHDDAHPKLTYFRSLRVDDAHRFGEPRLFFDSDLARRQYVDIARARALEQMILVLVTAHVGFKPISPERSPILAKCIA